MSYRVDLHGTRYRFPDLRALLAAASPRRSGDELAGLAAANEVERVAARYALADVPLATFLNEAVIPYESDEITRLIIDTHDTATFAPLASMTVGDLREWLLSHNADATASARAASGLTPEMVAAVSKLMRNQDLIAVGRKCVVRTAFRTTLGLPHRLSTRLQPNHPTNDARGIAASILDGLRFGVGDAVVGINPATDNVATTAAARSPPIRYPSDRFRNAGLRGYAAAGWSGSTWLFQIRCRKPLESRRSRPLNIPGWALSPSQRRRNGLAPTHRGTNRLGWNSLADWSGLRRDNGPKMRMSGVLLDKV